MLLKYWVSGSSQAVGTVAASQESCWSHSGTAASPRARPRGRHRHRALSPPGSCCQELGFSSPSYTFTGIIWSLAHVSPEPAWQILPMPSERSSSQCQLRSQGLQLQEAKRGHGVSELAFLGHQIHIKTFEIHNPTNYKLNYKLPSTCIYSPPFFYFLKNRHC